MLSDLESGLTDLYETWTVNEAGTAVTFADQDTNPNSIDRIIEQVSSLREIIEDRSLAITVEDPHQVIHYRILWQSNGSISCSEEADQGTAPDDIFVDDDCQSSVEKLRNDRVYTKEDILECVSPIAEKDDSSVSWKYTIPQQYVADAISDELDSDMDVSFNMKYDSFSDSVNSIKYEEARSFFLPDSSKHLFVTLDGQDWFFGSSIGHFPLSELKSDNFNSFKNKASTIHDRLNKVRKECAIDRFDELYFPPTLLVIDSYSNQATAEDFKDSVAGLQMISSIVGLSNIVRWKNESWNIRLNGRRVIESEISQSENHREIVNNSEAGETPVKFSLDTLNHFVNLFDWVYSVRTTDRITVFRNIATLYTTSVDGLIKNIDEISDSTKSNFRFYVEDSVESFVDVQQDISSYIFEMHQEVSDLRRNLANNLSQDLFRVLGLAIVSWGAILLRIEGLTTVRTALTISVIPLLVYLVLALRGARSLEHQFDSIQETKENYFEMYEHQVDSRTMDKLRSGDNTKRLESQFRTDLRLYYAIFTILVLICIYVIIDMSVAGPLSELIGKIISSGAEAANAS